MNENNLGFRIVGKVAVFDHPHGGSMRPATPEEVAMWPLVQAGNALAEAAGTNHGCPGEVMVLHPGGRSEMRKYECAVCDALAAFRAAKEEQRDV